jgi:hypothetical protein
MSEELAGSAGPVFGSLAGCYKLGPPDG